MILYSSWQGFDSGRRQAKRQGIARPGRGVLDNYQDVDHPGMQTLGA